MKPKAKRAKAKAQSDPQLTKAKKAFDCPMNANGSQKRKENLNQNETVSKSTADQWEFNQNVCQIFSTEIPENGELGKKKNTPKCDAKSQIGTHRYEQSQNSGTLPMPPDRNMYCKSTRKTIKARKATPDNRTFDAQPSTFSSSFEEASNKIQQSPHFIKHRPTLSKKAQYDYFVPKSHSLTVDEKRKKLLPTRNSKEIVKSSTEPIEIPLSVLSERYQDNIYTPRLPDEELFRFGDVYEANLYHLIHKYLEIDTFHRVAYVGPENGSLAQQLEEYFCLTTPVQSVYPGKVDYRDIKDTKKLLAFKIAHVGAEDFFSQKADDSAHKMAPFDRIIIHDAIQVFTNINVTLKNIMKTLHEFGKVLIIHRTGVLNTLPYFSNAKARFLENDLPYMNVIRALQKLGADVEWDLVHVPIVMSTSKWLAMLKKKFPAQVEIMSQYEISCGLRELSEGPLKYMHGETMEVEDRLMFITASHTTFDCAFPSVQRVGGASQLPYSGLADLKYKLDLTKDIEQFLPKSKASQYKMKSLF